MIIRELGIPDSYEVTPKVFSDDRGLFLEAYRFDELRAATGRSIDLAQVNTSVSRRGVVRGIHYADVPPSQAKYVTVAHGAIVDFVIDIRVGSPTFGQWDSAILDSADRHALFLSEGLGHAFIALTDDVVVSYLVTSVFNPSAEHGVNPLDTDVALRFPAEAGELVLSVKDTDAPSLVEAEAAGLLPSWEQCRQHYARLRNGI